MSQTEQGFGETEILCEKCGAEEIVSLGLGLGENCLEARDRYEEDRMAEYMREEV
jgi:hypothetical protein